MACSEGAAWRGLAGRLASNRHRELAGCQRLSHPRKLLFICSRNKRRSLTAEKLFEGAQGCQVRSAGTQPGARIVVTEGHLGWADVVICMEKAHVSQLRRKFPESISDKEVLCLHIADDYEYMEPALVEELLAKLEGVVDLPEH